jgi:hypothetical protein
LTPNLMKYMIKMLVICNFEDECRVSFYFNYDVTLHVCNLHLLKHFLTKADSALFLKFGYDKLRI